MSAGEVLWRAQSLARDTVDRYRVPAGRFPGPADAMAAGRRLDDPPAFRVTDMAVGEWARSDSPADRQWHARLRQEADAAVRHELTFFDLQRVHLGDPIAWNYEVKAGKPTPITFAPSIDYRDYREVGDCKLVWEPNRHHQLVVLGRAFRASGERRYAEAIVEQMESWLDQCAFGHGMNWRSPLELGVRLINWVWALDLIRESGLVAGRFLERVVHTSYLHAWEITRKLSRGTSGNNHLTGELAGVYVAATYFAQFAHRSEWRSMAAARLEQQLAALAAEDGGWGEHAVGYQLFVLQFFLIVGLTARAVGEDFSQDFWKRLERMLEFVAALLEGGPLPRFGDADDGYVLDLGARPGDPRGLLATGAVLFDHPGLRAASGRFDETARWLLPAAAGARFEALPASILSPIESRAFRQSGYYLLQSGHAGADDRISVFFDCAELGFGAIAAHGHADALSFTLRAFGRDVLVDPGTYDYFTYPAWRSYFRSTRAHNTVAIDGADQSEMLGPFLWGARAQARLVEWAPAPDGGHVTGEHDGYSRLPSPVRHRRRVSLDGRARVVTVHDELRSGGTHDVEVCFHASPDVAVETPGGNRVSLIRPEGTVTLLIDTALEVRVVRGADEPILGWVSTGYHVKRPAHTIVARGRISGDASFTCRMAVGQPTGAPRRDQE
jgi:hypothetical protein